MKATNENLTLLNTLFTTALVVSNIVTVKLLPTGCHLFGTEVVLPGAAICYACTFLFTDVIGEIWGRKEASKSVIYGVVCQLFASALLTDQLTTWRLLMKLNFEMQAMRGCWLALDEEEQMRICYQQPLAGLTPATFSALMLAFIQQAREMRLLLPEIVAA